MFQDHGGTEKEEADTGSYSWKGPQIFIFPALARGWEGGLCLEVVPRLVLRFSGCKIVLQEGLQVLKGGPLFSVLFPALQHQLVH